jgi:protein dithiol oxidoreductase (disulfide-forming)
MRGLVALLGLMLSWNLYAQMAPYAEGKQYFAITPAVKTADSSKIEVTEVFAYSCPHCFHFEPVVEAWAARQKSDVKFVQSHAMWFPAMEPHLRGFYTSLVLGINDKTQMAAFNAIHLEHKNLATAEQWADFFETFDVPKDKALSTYNSMEVTNLVKQAEIRAREYKIGSTPEMVVEGKYRVSTRDAGGQEEMLKVVDFLVTKVRAERNRGAVAK